MTAPTDMGVYALRNTVNGLARVAAHYGVPYADLIELVPEAEA